MLSSLSRSHGPLQQLLPRLQVNRQDQVKFDIGMATKSEVISSQLDLEKLKQQMLDLIFSMTICKWP